MAPFSLYIHIPYCDSKCPYCDFNSYAVKRWPERAYREALIAEMTAYAAQPAWRDAAVQTIFFGGGTPSLFAPESIAALLEATARIWPRTGPRIEITLEANPGTVDVAKLRGFAAAGIVVSARRSTPSRRRAASASTASTWTSCLRSPGRPCGSGKPTWRPP